MASGIFFDTADNAEGQLNAGINAAALSIALKSGEGAEFPQPYKGTCSSTGDSNTLNDTGDLGNLAVGDFIRNVTDGSWAFVTTLTSADSVETTRLQGGSDNTWTSGDEWRHGEFVITLEERDADGDVTDREKCLVENRSTDTLTVASGGRGYDGSDADTWSADDYVNLHVTSTIFDEVTQILADLSKWIDTLETENDTIINGSPFYGLATGDGDTIAVSIDSTVTAYADGLTVRFEANAANSGAATLNVNSIGAKDIKKEYSAALAANDIKAGQMVEVTFQATQDDFQMMSPVANAPSTYSSGMMMLWTTDTAPSGWLLCYGQAISRTTYSDLFAVISTTYGVGDGSTTFNVPDLRGRFPLGQDDMGGASADRVTHANADTLGGAEGSETHALIEAELAAHKHKYATNYAEGKTVASGSGATVIGDVGNDNDDDAHKTTSIGSGTAHENMSPYITLNYIIKT